jgi:hypothetical protein
MFDLTSVARITVAGALCAGAMFVTPLRAQDSGSSSPSCPAQARNDCRLAKQVLQTGQPTNKRRWALGRIAGCGGEGGRVIAELLTARRHEVARTRELDEVVSAGLGLLDRKLYESALEGC